jgi:hypothetical protein
MPEESERERRKVDFPVFVWVITILSGAMLTISGYLFSEIAALRTAKAELGAKLEAEREKNTSILVTLAEIKGDIKNFTVQLDRRPTR